MIEEIVQKVSSNPIHAALLNVLAHVDEIPFSELAQRAGMSSGTANDSLLELVASHLVEVKERGRHRYFRLADPAIVRAVQSLPSPTSKQPKWTNTHLSKEEQIARTCYRHLAGTFGVFITRTLSDPAYLQEGETEFIVTPSGEDFFQTMDIRVSQLRQQKRILAKKCLDHSERRFHLAGTLGQTLLQYFRSSGWVQNHQGRAIKVTPEGKSGLRLLIGIDLNEPHLSP